MLATGECRSVRQGVPVALLSITEAARRAGVDRSTIQRAVRAGRLSATRDGTGRRCIDAAELVRVYGAPPLHAARTDEALPQADMVALLREQVQALQADKAHLAALLAREQQQVDAYRQQVEELRQQQLPGPRRGWLARVVEALGRARGKGQA
jgi:excisionase family DNA binding protein